MSQTKRVVLFVGMVFALVSVSTTPGRADSLATGLQAYYQFNGNGLDSSGNGLNLSLVGSPAFGPGLYGQALALHGGPSQYANLSADPTAFNFGSNDFTIQVWVNFNSFGSSVQSLIEKFSGETGPGWTLVAINNFLQFYAGGMPEVDSSPVSISPGSWSQIAVERDGTTLSLFLDGQLLVADTDYVGAISSSTNPLMIGRRTAEGAGDLPVDGRLDEIAIWNRALDSTEIASLWNGGLGMSLPVNSVPEPPALTLAIAALCLVGGRAAFSKVARKRRGSS